MKKTLSTEPHNLINKPTKLFCLLMTVAVAAIMIFSPISDAIYAKLFSDAAQTKVYLMGDVDLNDKVEPSDARTILRVAVQLEMLEGVEKGEVLANDAAEPTKGQLADIDGDGKITPADARAVLRMAVRLDEQKTIEVTEEETTTEPETEPSIGDVETTMSKREEISANISAMVADMKKNYPEITEEQFAAIEKEMRDMLDNDAEWEYIRQKGIEMLKNLTYVETTAVQTESADAMIDRFINSARETQKALTEAQIDVIEKEMRDMLAGGAKVEDVIQYGVDRVKALNAQQTETTTLRPTPPPPVETTTDAWLAEFNAKMTKAAEYVDAVMPEYSGTSRYDECQSKVYDMIVAGKSDAEIKKFVKDFRDELKQKEEPTTYWTGEHNEYCMWCGGPMGRCYDCSFGVDRNCPGCGQFVKAHTRHICKAYHDLFYPEDFTGEDKSNDPNRPDELVADYTVQSKKINK